MSTQTKDSRRRVTVIAVLDVVLDEGCDLRTGDDPTDADNVIGNLPTWLDALFRSVEHEHDAAGHVPTYRVRDLTCYTLRGFQKARREGFRPLYEFVEKTRIEKESKR